MDLRVRLLQAPIGFQPNRSEVILMLVVFGSVMFLGLVL